MSDELVLSVLQGWSASRFIPPINIYRSFELQLKEPLANCFVLVSNRNQGATHKAPATLGSNVLGYLDPQTRYSVKVSCRGFSSPAIEFITSTAAQVRHTKILHKRFEQHTRVLLPQELTFDQSLLSLGRLFVEQHGATQAVRVERKEPPLPKHTRRLQLRSSLVIMLLLCSHALMIMASLETG